MKCIVCEREKLFETEGRFIDGSWKEDVLLEEYKNKWVCCYFCYKKLTEKKKNKQKEGRK